MQRYELGVRVASVHIPSSLLKFVYKVERVVGQALCGCDAVGGGAGDSVYGVCGYADDLARSTLPVLMIKSVHECAVRSI